MLFPFTMTIISDANNKLVLNRMACFDRQQINNFSSVDILPRIHNDFLFCIFNNMFVDWINEQGDDVDFD